MQDNNGKSNSVGSNRGFSIRDSYLDGHLKRKMCSCEGFESDGYTNKYAMQSFLQKGCFVKTFQEMILLIKKASHGNSSLIPALMKTCCLSFPGHINFTTLYLSSTVASSRIPNWDAESITILSWKSMAVILKSIYQQCLFSMLLRTSNCKLGVSKKQKFFLVDLCHNQTEVLQEKLLESSEWEKYQRYEVLILSVRGFQNESLKLL